MADDAGAAENQFLYDAFISYRHVDRDRKWAEWLIAALEGYRLPKALQERGLPSRLRKVFRDEDELPSSPDLNDQIREALRASRFLIVVCSAFTPRSKWVEREIQVFNELGRGDQVLALLTEGEPGDSFPDAMLVRHRQVVEPDGSTRIVKEDKEPLAADVRPRPGVSSETLKHLALLRLVAVILGLKFDDLRQREHEREHKRHLTWAAIAAALVLLIGGSGGFYWNLVRPHTSYYRNLVWRWGLPEGAWPIDAATHARLPHSYSIVTQRGKVTEVRYDGWLVSQTDAARWVVHYADDTSPQKIEIFSETGRLLQDEVLHPASAGKTMIMNFERNGIPLAQAATHELLNDPTQAAQGNALNKTEISRHELTFDNSGFPIEVRYQDSWGTPQHDAQGSFGERYSYSPEGLVIRSTEIGPHGEDITLKNGVHLVTSSYDEDGRLVQRTLIGEDGRPINGPDGYAYFIRDYHPPGDADTMQTYYGADGKPTLSRDGYSKLIAQHDPRGNNTQIAFAGTDGKLIASKSGFAVMQREFDDRGRVIAETFFDANHRPTYTTFGIAADKVLYDQHNNIVQTDNQGADGGPTINKEGYAKITRKYDTRSNLIDEAYFDVNGKPTLNKNDCAESKQVFNERDQRTELACFDVSGSPTLSKEGWAEIKYTYDARGNETKREFFGIDGKLALNPDGFVGFRQTFDDRGLLVTSGYFGVNGEPVLSKSLGRATVHYTYDVRGNPTGIDYLGVDGKPFLGPGGLAGLRTTYDDRGRMVEVKIIGLDGRPAASFEGIARTRLTYDSRGNVVERDFFGVDGKPTLGTAGHAGLRFKYDDEGNLVEIIDLGTDGKPMDNPISGVAISRQSFDSRHNRVGLWYFGLDGKPVLTSERIAQATYAFDSRGNNVKRAFFGLDGKPTPGIVGFASTQREYDDRNDLVKQSFFGVDGKLVNIRDGAYAKVTWSYDGRGDLLEESYFGPDGSPSHADGAVTIKYTYDDQGRQTKVTYLDAQGRELQMELVVRRVVQGGLGAQAGLKPGDHLLSYNGQQVNSVKQLGDLTSSGTYPFRTITVRRNSQVITLQAERGHLGIIIGLGRADGREAAAAPAPPPAPSR